MHGDSETADDETRGSLFLTSCLGPSSHKGPVNVIASVTATLVITYRDRRTGDFNAPKIPISVEHFSSLIRLF